MQHLGCAPHLHPSMLCQYAYRRQHHLLGRAVHAAAAAAGGAQITRRRRRASGAAAGCKLQLHHGAAPGAEGLAWEAC